MRGNANGRGGVKSGERTQTATFKAEERERRRFSKRENANGRGVPIGRARGTARCLRVAESSRLTAAKTTREIKSVKDFRVGKVQKSEIEKSEK